MLIISEYFHLLTPDKNMCLEGNFHLLRSEMCCFSQSFFRIAPSMNTTQPFISKMKQFYSNILKAYSKKIKSALYVHCSFSNKPLEMNESLLKQQ